MIWFVQEGGDDDDSQSPAQEGGSEAATGVGAHEEDNLSDDISDAGWDTDLDIEGLGEIFSFHE